MNSGKCGKFGIIVIGMHTRRSSGSTVLEAVARDVGRREGSRSVESRSRDEEDNGNDGIMSGSPRIRGGGTRCRRLDLISRLRPWPKRFVRVRQVYNVQSVLS